MIDKFVWSNKDFLVVFSAGNNGPVAGSVGSPSVNKDGVSVGWSGNGGATCDGATSQNTLSSSSSRGATDDGRAKPDIAATGAGRSAMSDGDPLDSGNTAEGCWTGTSYSAPAAAGGAAIARQYLAQGWWPTGAPVAGNAFEPSAAQMKSLLLASGRRMTCTLCRATGSWTYPNYNQGWGRYTLDDALYLAGDVRDTWLLDYTSGLTTGLNVTTKFSLAGATEGLRIVMAYSDYPGAVAANPALVNDLDMVVTSPSGTSYNGNCWGTAFALPPTSPNSDTRPNSGPGSCSTTDLGGFNPVEGVILHPANTGLVAGEWTIRVTGSNVPVGPQPFALTVVGDLDRTYGFITLDKPEYSEGEKVNIRVVDTDGPAGSLFVSLASTTETSPEFVQLNETGDGIYEGNITLAFGAVVNGDNCGWNARR